MSDSLFSTNGRFRLVLQDDGNMVTRDLATDALVWDSRSGVFHVPVVIPDPPVPPIPPEPTGDILDVHANFCALWDDTLGQAIFTSCYPSQDAETREYWLQRAREVGDTHYVISNVQGYPPFYTDLTDYFLSGKMETWNRRLLEVYRAGFWPIVFIHSGDTHPGVQYFIDFIKAVPQEMWNKVLWCCGWEVVPGAWTTKQFCDTIRAMRQTLGGNVVDGPHLIRHPGDGRLSFSSNPVEADDPYQGDEIACVRDPETGGQISLYFHQAQLTPPGDPLDENIPGSPMERSMECLTRVQGTHWQNAPDWFAGLPWRWKAYYFEQNEQLYVRKRCTRDWLLTVWAKAKSLGFIGYGAGT